MSRLYDTVEPSVIDDEMLQVAVEEQGPKDEAGRIAKDEGMDFEDVESLRLDFKNILKVDNLWCFTGLVKLQLDNNIIEKIEGLDALVNLVWLDLSFNNIEIIEGLDNLTKLEDLTLYNNRISRIENMDNLRNLHVFSIGNNDLKELDMLVGLRKFKKLRTLSLNGNPFCELPEYKFFLVAHLPNLEYLDYRLIDQNTREAADEKHSLTIEELLADEAAAERKQAALDEKEREIALHKLAFVENLNGPELFDGLYAEDPEGQKLNLMPGVDEKLEQFKEKFVALCQQIFDFGIEEHAKRSDEVNLFNECLNDAQTENKNNGMCHINNFMEYKKTLFADLPTITDQKLLETKTNEYHAMVTELRDKLMGLELNLVEQLEEVIKDFERNLADLVQGFVENVQGLISQCRELENMHNEVLQDIANNTLEKVIKNELEEDIDEDLRAYFVDKDTIMNAVTASHDVHLLKIDNQEDDIVTRINNWQQTLNKDIMANEGKRNRARISEISNLIDHLREEIDTLDLQGMGY